MFRLMDLYEIMADFFYLLIACVRLFKAPRSQTHQSEKHTSHDAI